MAQDPRSGRMHRPGMPGDQSNAPGDDEEVTLSQAIPNMPLPPYAPPDPVTPAAPGTFMPLPLSLPGGASVQSSASSQQTNQPGISVAWAVQTTFLLMFTSLILLVLLVATTANALHNLTLVVWTVIIIVAVMVLYPILVFQLARRVPGQPGKWSLFGPFRRP
jgi:hypothetical protein